MRRLALLLALLFALFVGLEFLLRGLLFSNSPWISERASWLRDATQFSSFKEETYWKLMAKFTRANGGRDSSSTADSLLGWVHQQSLGPSYDHKSHAIVLERRPVLVFGDSFARCFSTDRPCWEDFMKESELFSEFCILNYGVNAYGFDQTVALMREALHNYASENPLVVLGIYVDDNLERCRLRLRDFPRAFFEPTSNGGLEFHSPTTTSVKQYLVDNPLEVRSYLWRFLLFRKVLFSEAARERYLGRAEEREHCKELNRRLIALAIAELQARDLDYFFVVFNEERSLGRGWQERWQEAFLIQELERVGAPYILSRPALHSAALATGRGISDYYLRGGPGAGHLNELGSRVVFAEMLQGLRGSFVGARESRFAHIDEKIISGKRTSVRWERRGSQAGDPIQNCLILKLDDPGAVRLTYDCGEPDQLWSSLISATNLADNSPLDCKVRFSVELDEDLALSQELRVGEVAWPIELQIGEARHLRVRAEHPCRDHGPVLLRLTEPRLLP